METWNVKLKFCYMHNILRFLRARQTLVETDKLGTLIMVDSNENKCSKKKFSCTFFFDFCKQGIFFIKLQSYVQSPDFSLGTRIWLCFLSVTTTTRTRRRNPTKIYHGVWNWRSSLIFCIFPPWIHKHMKGLTGTAGLISWLPKNLSTIKVGYTPVYGALFLKNIWHSRFILIIRWNKTWV